MSRMAHNEKKYDVGAFARRHQQILSGFRIVATGTTGGKVQEACPDLNVTRLKSGPLGGDQQISAMTATGDVALRLFFIEPLSSLPPDVDGKALHRLTPRSDLPTAPTVATAENN